MYCMVLNFLNILMCMASSKFITVFINKILVLKTQKKSSIVFDICSAITTYYGLCKMYVVFTIERFLNLPKHFPKQFDL